ncbi:NnrS family protein [Aquabacterium sp. A7-Y]|uniref:NnrS family protein n=1 Tax=Aquabacterium sp. A7-Y TaxID=1349605 RepID=UPI00223D21D2|nr:NnrS family protein [Aquabacterium sp. A7-Y]MCW7537894.1 NnrS family protein [Aquabacterium sp. A7-Y]
MKPLAPFLHIDEPPLPAAPRGIALWQLGFRPFYLLASGFAALSIALWGAQSAGWLPWAYLRGPAWHAHEMLFGFTLAVVVGFLFTAGRNWSGQPTPSGPALMALAALWVAARVLVLTPFGLAAALANLAFVAGSAWGLARALWAGRNRRNYFFVGLLALLGLASLAVHLSQFGWIGLPPWAGLQLGLDLTLFILAVMGGRVIPMFTNNGVPGASAQRHRWVERVALGSVIALTAADLSGLAGWASVSLLVLAALAHAVRLLLWQPWRTWHTPLVWVLHAAYLWIPLHLALRAAAAAGAVPATLATHALTVGAIGGLVIGMMTRTARGHTARPLRADRWDVAAYVLVLSSALLRVGLPLAAPTRYVEAIAGSAALWSLGFALYAWHYGPMLLRPRLDGKPG